MILTAPSPHEIVYLDLPWPRTPCGTAKTPYKTMSWAELHDFDLGSWIGPDALVFCWMTGPTHLKEASVLSTWCDRFGLYEAGIAYFWVKTRTNNVPGLPPGYTIHGRKHTNVRLNGEYVEKCCEIYGNTFQGPAHATDAAWGHWQKHASEEWLEFIESSRMVGRPIGASGPRPKLVKQLGELVIAMTTRKRGRVFPLLTESQRQWVFAPKPRPGEHSRKPPVVRDKIVELLGDRHRVELFSREQVAGWNAWGDDVGASEKAAEQVRGRR